MPAPLPWLHLYTEARNDRKLDTLTDAEHRVWFNLLCLAGEQEDRGTFEADDSLSLEVARGDDALLAATIEKLTSRQLRILVDNEDGTFTFRRFDERNKRKPSDTPEATAERKRAQRERDRKAAEEAAGPARDGEASRPVTRRHAPVTHRGEESREEETREEDQGQGSARGVVVDLETSPPKGDIAIVGSAYERLTGQTMPASSFVALCAEHPTELLVESIRRGARAGKTHVSYIAGIARGLTAEHWQPDPALTEEGPNPYFGLCGEAVAQ